MVGNNDWDDEKFDVIQEGSQSWTGRVIVWNGKFWNSGAHGRRDNGSKAGQWAAGDTIELKSCVDKGKFSQIYQISCQNDINFRTTRLI